MKTDRLEEFILRNRGAFDDSEPDPAIWSRIEKRKGRIVTMNWRQIAWRAAAVAVIFTASYFFHDIIDRRNEPVLAEQPVTESEEQPQIVKDLFEAQVFYTSQIDLKRDELFRLAAGQPGVMEDIDAELTDLDQVFQELKEDLNDNAHNEEVLEAMMQNYRLKLQILEDMLYLLRQSNAAENHTNHENQTREM